MESKEIILTVLLLAIVAFSLYRRYAMKNKGKMGRTAVRHDEKTGLSGQPDDYEPYSKGKH